MSPNLLSPVQDFTSLNAAINAKADAVYFGTKEFNLRKGAHNFELKDLNKVIAICHKNNVKAFFTLNSVVYDNELKKIKVLLQKLKKIKIDAIIAWDFSIINECNKLGIPIHISTQASISNYDAIKSLKKQFHNIQSINLARELSLEQIKKIIKTIKKEKLDVEIEVFVHGAMCVSISGRCFISQFLFNKSANKGECLQPCRRSYIIKDTEENHELEIGNNYVLSPKDLCALPFLERLIDAKIDTFKIEGRNRSPEYVKIVTDAYRELIEFCKKNKNKEQLKKEKEVLIEKIKTVYNRGFSQGFYLGKPINEWTDEYGSKATKKKSYVGKILNYYNNVSAAEIKIESGKICQNDSVIIQGPTTGVIEQNINSMQLNKLPITIATKGMGITIKLDKKVRKNDKVYRIEKN